MLQYTAGFIGAGNMGGALLGAAKKTGEKLAVYDPDEAKARATGADFLQPETLVKESRFVFLGVKPNLIESVCAGIENAVTKETVFVSMAAGVTLETLVSLLKTENIIRIMPNTPVSVGAGMVLYCCAGGVDEETEAAFLSLLQHAGRLTKTEEKLMDAGMAVSGCGPAYAYMFCEALADGAVKCGLPRDKAQLFAAQTLLGSAQMLLQSGLHPGALKDAVCSPGGATIEGVLALENANFRAAVSDAVVKGYEKVKK
ncbi:MAG: pyrroline-5-carboxylate reductase [Clostridia bacterium]|nr:pyrroline-5-carboxylate reductase [Clostridia bacterium]